MSKSIGGKTIATLYPSKNANPQLPLIIGFNYSTTQRLFYLEKPYYYNCSRNTHLLITILETTNYNIISQRRSSFIITLVLCCYFFSSLVSLCKILFILTTSPMVNSELLFDWSWTEYFSWYQFLLRIDFSITPSLEFIRFEHHWDITTWQ